MIKKIFFLLSLLPLLTYAQHTVTPLNTDDVLKETQWKGQWIGIDQLLAGESIDNKTRVNARYLRSNFALEDKTIKSAKAYIAAVGYYELYINGQRIGCDNVLTPTQTDTRKAIIYNVWDVKAAVEHSQSLDSLKHKAGAVGVILGNGRAVPMRYLKHQKCPFMGFPKCRVDIIVTYSDGKTQRICSSDKWKATAEGPIRSNNEYDGEVYDSQRNMPGWADYGYDDSQWQYAERAEIPLGTQYPQTAPNQVATPLSSYSQDFIHPSLVKRTAGAAIFDLHQNIAGWVSLKVHDCKAGDTIRIKYAEKLTVDPSLYTDNLRSAETEDLFICNGRDTVWHPTFVYHGGRYISVSGMNGVSDDDITPYIVSDDISSIGTFVSSNSTLNAVYRNAWWGIKDNYHGFPTDCPQRDERQPWLGDRTVGSLGESYLFDNNKLYTRWMRDICDAQRYDGAIPDVAPAFWNYYTDNVTWPACLPFTCEMLYEQFGNDEPIRDSYPYIKKWINHISEDYMKDGIITKDKYGDWCVPPESLEIIRSKDPARLTDGALLSTAYMIHIMQQMSRFATIQGFTKEAEEYAAKAKEMTDAFNKKFLHIKRGTSPEPGHPLFPDSIFYGNNTATANIIPLAFGLVPDDCRQAVIDNVVKNIITDNNGHVSCGVIGISYLLRTLTANGYGDVAYLIATNNTYPSWGYMAEHGASTTWELWNGDTANPKMNSGNHVMLLGDLLTWCYQDLAGIKNAPGTVGYEHLLMKPDFSIQDLDSIDCSYFTPHGKVISHWKKTLEKLHWEVTLPDGVTADCVLPDGTVRQLTTRSLGHSSSWTFDVPMPLMDKKNSLTSARIVESEFIYDHSQYPETHSSSIVELNDGTLLATYFGGTKERNPDVCIWTQRKAPGSHEWSKPVLAADGVFPDEPVGAMKGVVKEQYVPASAGPCREQSRSHLQGDSIGKGLRTACWNPVLYQMPDGEVWLFFKIGRNVGDWTGWLCKSKDGGLSWSDKEQLPDSLLGPIKNKPVLIDNKLICPSSTERGGWKLHFEIYDLTTGKWTYSMAKNCDNVLAIQPSILVHGLDKSSKTGEKRVELQCVARTRPTKAQRDSTDLSRGKVATCWSSDGGKTWGETSLLDVPNNQSGLDAVTLMKPVKVKCSDGTTHLAKHVLIYNNFGTLPGTPKGPRTPLSLAVSEDGITWHHLLTLEDSPISQYSYPAIIQGKDGSLHCTYTWRRQRVAYKRVVLK